MEILKDTLYEALLHNGRVQVTDKLREEFKSEIPEIAEASEIRFTLRDVLTNSMLAPLFPEVITVIVEDTMEPLLLITKLYDVVRGIPNALTVRILLPTPMPVVKLSPNAPTPNLGNPSLHEIGGTVSITAEKWGVIWSVDEHVIKNNQWDILKMSLRNAARALARHKEKQAYEHIRHGGIILFSNWRKNHAVFKNFLRGRDIKLRQNGSLSPRDFFQGYAYFLQNEFIPDVVIMNSWSWLVFLYSPLTREIVMNGNTIAPDFTNFNMRVRSRWREVWNSLGKKGILGGNSPDDIFGKIGLSIFEPTNAPWSWNPLGVEVYHKPSWMPAGITFLISPYADWSANATDYMNKYFSGWDFTGAQSWADTATPKDPLNIFAHNDAANKNDPTKTTGFKEDGTVATSPSDARTYADPTLNLTDIIMVDSSEVGILYQYSDPTTTKWSDPMLDIQNNKIAEEYGFAVKWGGRAIGIFEAVVIDEQYTAELVAQNEIAKPL